MKFWLVAALLAQAGFLPARQANHLLHADGPRAWSIEIGRLDSGMAHAVFTAFAAGQEVRGLKVTLELPDWKGPVYIPETQLPLLKHKVDQLAAASARDWSASGWNVMIGTNCPGEKKELPLRFGYHLRGAAAAELLLDGPGLPAFVFVGPKPADLAGILTGAMEALSTR